jgi:hypothetical protein
MNSNGEHGGEWPSTSAQTGKSNGGDGPKEGQEVASPSNSNLSASDDESSPSPAKCVDDSPIFVPDGAELAGAAAAAVRAGAMPPALAAPKQIVPALQPDAFGSTHAMVEAKLQQIKDEEA